jgi:RNA polymerase sigma factor (sigma-70 family)
LSELVNDRQKKVLDMMTRLNNLAREVIVMHYIEQESYEQIARRLGKKPQHIRSISAKALARLRQLLT